MSEPALIRCMGGARCNHFPGTCTATNEEYKAKALANLRPLTDHPNAEDWRNRAERAEAECEELRKALKEAMFQSFADEAQWLDLTTERDELRKTIQTHDGLTLAVGLTQLQSRYDALLGHAEALAEALGVVRAYHYGEGEFNFTSMTSLDRECAMFDAWQIIRDTKLVPALAAFTAWQLDGKE